MNERYSAAFAAAGLFFLAAVAARGQEKVQLDPFAQATRGYPRCAEQAPPLRTPEQARVDAHVRVERGLRCAEEGKCEPGGSYRRDPEINERIRALIAGEPHFADTAVWLTTSRHWVTLQGCVRSATQRKTLVGLVGRQPGVERVFDELVVGRQ